MKKPLKWPDFSDEDAVHEWMDKTDFSEYLEPSDLEPFNIDEFLQKTKPRTRKMTIRLPESWIVQAKVIAAQMDIPYQALIKQFIGKGLHAVEGK